MKDMHRLLLDLRGPGLNDRVEILEEDPADLEPTLIVDSLGVEFARYGTEHDFIEVRVDYIVVRSRNIILGERSHDGVQPVRRLGPGPVGGDR